MKNLALLSLLSLLAACVAEAPKVELSGFNRNAPMMWNGSFPKTIRISEDFDEEERQVIADMAESWNTAVNNKKTFYKVGANLPPIIGTPEYNKMDTDGVFGIYKTARMPEGTSGATIAVTVLKIRTQNYGQENEYNQIFYTDIYVNDNFFFRPRTPFNHSDSATFDLNSVMVHELGHALGLGHKDSKIKSVMIPAITEAEKMNAPLPVDVSDISYKYGIQTSLGGGAAAMATSRPNYVPDNKEDTPFVKYIIELKKDGDCVHSVDGQVIERHRR